MLRSELLKLKNTFGLYLILSFAVLEIITIPMYVSFVPNGFSLTNLAILSLGTIYQFTPPPTYCIYENIKKDDFRFGSRLFNFNSCSLLKSYAFYIIVGNFQGQFFHLKTTV